MAPVNADDGPGSPLFMNEMYNSGAIDKKVFSLFCVDHSLSVNSKLLIGGYNLTKYA